MSPEFEHAGFVRAALNGFKTRELKQRASWLVECLRPRLPERFEDAAEILLGALPPPLDPTPTDDDFGRFIWGIPAEFVAKFGCSPHTLQQSLNFLEESTKRFSAENPIRVFLNAYPQETMAYVRRWARDDNYHVRRLASEGIRPFLPWSPRISIPLADIIEVLSTMHADNTRYVTRSVTNNLNDITKLARERVFDALKQWREEGRQKCAGLDWMTRHSLRTLLKLYDPRALKLLGYHKPEIEFTDSHATDVVLVGDSFEWRGKVTALESQKLLLTLRMHFLKANGQHSTKVFALKDLQMARGETLEIVKKIPFRPITTRVLYPGKHFVELAANGEIQAQCEFDLRTA